MNYSNRSATNAALAFSLFALAGAGTALADTPPSRPNCADLGAQATITCVGSIRGLMSPSPIDKALGAAAMPVCLKGAYDTAACYQRQGSSRPGGGR